MGKFVKTAAYSWRVFISVLVVSKENPFKVTNIVGEV